jgi:hypothetical protein
MLCSFFSYVMQLLALHAPSNVCATTGTVEANWRWKSSLMAEYEAWQ